MCHFLSAKSPDALSMRSCQIFSYRRWKWAFAQQKQLLVLAIEAQFLIYNFAMVANRHGRYHCQQPPENKLTFFSFSVFLPSIQRDGQLSWKWCAGLFGLMRAVSQISEGPEIDSEDDEEILMHIYQLIKGQQGSFVASQPFPRCLRLSLEPCLHPWNPPFPFSYEELLHFLVFHGFIPVSVLFDSKDSYKKKLNKAEPLHLDHEVEEVWSLAKATLFYQLIIILSQIYYKKQNFREVITW